MQKVYLFKNKSSTKRRPYCLQQSLLLNCLCLVNRLEIEINKSNSPNYINLSPPKTSLDKNDNNINPITQRLAARRRRGEGGRVGATSVGLYCELNCDLHNSTLATRAASARLLNLWRNKGAFSGVVIITFFLLSKSVVQNVNIRILFLLAQT